MKIPNSRCVGIKRVLVVALERACVAAGPCSLSAAPRAASPCLRAAPFLCAHVQEVVRSRFDQLREELDVKAPGVWHDVDAAGTIEEVAERVTALADTVVERMKESFAAKRKSPPINRLWDGQPLGSKAKSDDPAGGYGAGAAGDLGVKGGKDAPLAALPAQRGPTPASIGGDPIEAVDPPAAND